MKTTRSNKIESSVLSIFLLILLFSIGPLSSCSHPSEGVDKIPPICFDTQVLPILQSNCTMEGCHGGGSQGRGITFSDYASVLKEVTPYDSKNSRIYTAITSRWSNVMPPSTYPPLSVDQRTIIDVWIQQGAKRDTTCK